MASDEPRPYPDHDAIKAMIPDYDSVLVDNLITAGGCINRVQEILAPITHPHNKGTRVALKKLVQTIDALMFVYYARPQMEAEKLSREAEAVKEHT